MTEETTRKEEFRFDGDKVWERIKALGRAGNVRHLVLKNKNDKDVFSMTVTIAVIIAFLAPQIVAILILIALFAGCSIVIEKEEILSK